MGGEANTRLPNDLAEAKGDSTLGEWREVPAPPSPGTSTWRRVPAYFHPGTERVELIAPPWQRRVLRRIPWGLRRWFDPHHYPRYRFVCEASARVRPGEIVLDAGAGECPFAELFGHARYVAVDDRSGNPGWDFSQLSLVSDLFAMGLRPESVDHVLCNDVLEHVPDPGGLLRALFEVLRPGGNLFLSAPQGWGEHQAPHDYFRFTSYSLRMLMTEAGFEVEEIRPLHGFFYYLANRLQMVPIVLFPPAQRTWVEWTLLPVKIPAFALFGVVLPMLVMPFDRFDRDKTTTLNYACWCRKPLRA